VCKAALGAVPSKGLPVHLVGVEVEVQGCAVGVAGDHVASSLETLQNQHLEHHNATRHRPTRFALARLDVHTLKNRQKNTPINHRVQPLQRVPRLAQTGVAVLKIK
jgi:hypothetical protein